MHILITNNNISFFKNRYKIKKESFKQLTENTCEFKISKNKFEAIYKDLQRLGLNPFAYMVW
jgi:hypothetical protein